MKEHLQLHASQIKQKSQHPTHTSDNNTHTQVTNNIQQHKHTPHTSTQIPTPQTAHNQNKQTPCNSTYTTPKQPSLDHPVVP